MKLTVVFFTLSLIGLALASDLFRQEINKPPKEPTNPTQTKGAR